MAGKITTNSVVLGDSITDTQNFVLKTNADGTATLARGALGGLGTVFGVNGSGALTGATLVAPALGTPASGVLTNCTGVPASALPAGSVLQVVNVATQINTQTASTSYVDTGVSLSITPKFSTSKILVLVNMTGVYKNAANIYGLMQLVRNSTALIKMEGAFGYDNSTGENNVGATSACYLDSPATTSSTTYKTQISINDSSGFVGIGRNNATSTITLMEIAG